MRQVVARKRAAFDPLAALIRPRLLDEMLRRRRDRLDQESRLLSASFTRFLADAARKTLQDRTDLAAKALAIAVDAEARTFPSTVSSPVIKTSQQQSELDDEIGAGDGTELVIFTRVLEYRIDYRV